MKNIFFLFIILFSNICFATKSYILEGVLGKSTIYMYFEDNATVEDNRITDIRYFYKNSLKDIVLSGVRNGSKYIFKFEQNDIIVEQFDLIKSSENVFEGNWKDKKGLHFTIKLIPFDKATFLKNNPTKLALNQSIGNAFDFLKASLIQFKLDSSVVIKGKTFDWFSEKHCNAVYFRLSKGFTEAVKTKINPVLNRLHYENVLQQLNCSSSFEYSSGNGIESRITIDYLDSNLLGFNQFDSYYCGGAHPDFGGQGFLLDLKTGKSYEIDDIISFDKSVTTEKKSGFDKFSEYRNKFFASKLLALINKKEHFEKPKTDEDCDYTNLEFWEYPSWYISDKGIWFTPIFFRAARNCEEAFLVSFSDLRKYLHPKFPYKL
jgi:hypothetical protein